MGIRLFRHKLLGRIETRQELANRPVISRLGDQRTAQAVFPTAQSGKGKCVTMFHCLKNEAGLFLITPWGFLHIPPNRTAIECYF